MDPWTISAHYEIRRAEDRERASRPSRGLRERAAALLALAARLAPSIEEALPESRPAASVPQL